MELNLGLLSKSSVEGSIEEDEKIFTSLSLSGNLPWGVNMAGPGWLILE